MQIFKKIVNTRLKVLLTREIPYGSYFFANLNVYVGSASSYNLLIVTHLIVMHM